ncbi:MAG: hypothetical protein MJK14_28820, partial [Rivularia sp. ALOHA_DT_140]|nr:hypothetical protein [Rivularia sp. ALOHA_DT_140]
PQHLSTSAPQHLSSQYHGILYFLEVPKCKVLERANRYILHLDSTNLPQTLICDYFRFFSANPTYNLELFIIDAIAIQKLRIKE